MGEGNNCEVNSGVISNDINNVVCPKNYQAIDGDNAQTNALSVYYTNADSLCNKVNEVQALADIYKYDAICITETLPKHSINRSQLDNYTFNLVNYVSYHKVTGRGVSIFIRKSLESHSVDFSTVFNDNIWVSIELENKSSLLLGCLYRSPNSDVANNEALLSILNEIRAHNPANIVIVGDFNLKETDWINYYVHARPEHIAMKVFDTLNDLFYEQLVKEPTRHREGERPSLLDWVVTDKVEIIDNLTIGAPLAERADHNSITFDILLTASSCIMPERLNLYKGNYEALRQTLSKIPWNAELGDMNCSLAWEKFHEIMMFNIALNIPKRSEKRMHKKSKIWVDANIRKSIASKNKAWNTYRKNKTPSNWKQFTTIRNSTNKAISKAKYAFEYNIAANIKSNPKQFWRYVSSKSSVSREFPKLIDEEGKIYESDSSKAELFNNYFASVFTVEDLSYIPNITPCTNSELAEVDIDEQKVLKHLEKLNISKAAGPDDLHSKILFEVRDIIKTPLSIIFKKSVNEGILPSMWKHAIVKPLFKKGSKKYPKNYRPVSLTSVCCKTLERIVRDTVIDYLEKNEIITDIQHGFRAGRSCVTQLLEIMEIWSDLLDQGIPFDCIYLDFAKAFDKVPHYRLLRKIEAHGIKGNLLQWLSNFLENRSQAVVINNDSSTSKNVTSGIPQGSVLGPTLFILFINDISNDIESQIRLFADDTKIFRAISETADNTILQADIDKLLAWSNKWQLPFNIDKCKVIHFGQNNDSVNYKMYGNSVVKDESEKDLGVLFDHKLKFSTHVRAIVSKANSRVGLLRRNFTNLSPTVFLPLYKALIRPLLEYASVIWNPILKGDQDEIEKVQKRATKLVRPISHLPYNVRLRTLKLDSLRYRRRRADLIQVYRILQGTDNIDSNIFFTMSGDQRTRGHNKKLSKIRGNTSHRLNSFSMRIVNDWNSLSESTVNSVSLNVFKTALKNEWSDHPERFDD